MATGTEKLHSYIRNKIISPYTKFPSHSMLPSLQLFPVDLSLKALFPWNLMKSPIRPQDW